MTRKPHFIVIDPALKRPELECLNDIILSAPLPVTYHMPAMFGMNSLECEDIGSIRGIIILGSASTVNDRAQWQIELETWLMPVLQKRIPTLGLCYGHQMLAYMFGGRVEYMFADLTKHKGFRNVMIEGLGEKGPWQKSHGSLLVSHNEHVSSCPPSMRVIASSPEVKIEGLAHNDLPIFSFQAHPEANVAFLNNQAIERPADANCFAFGEATIANFLKFATSFASH